MVAILLFARPLWAADSADGIALAFEVRGCPYLRSKEVSRVLLAELRAEPASATDTDATRVVAQCVGELLVLEVTDPVSRKFVRRHFALRDPEHPGMSRLVGIAAAELVLASWAELSLNPKPRVEPDGPAPTPRQLDATRQRVASHQPTEQAPDLPPRRLEEPVVEETPPSPEPSPKRERTGSQLRVVALGSRRSFFSHDGALWGGGARIGSEPLVRTSWAADTLFESGEIRQGRNVYQIDSLTLGGQLLFYQRVLPVTFRFGGGLRAGLTVAAPESEDAGRGARAVSPWGWPLMVLDVSVCLDRAVFELSAEASYVAVPVSSGATAETLRGAWFSTQLGVGFLP